jgi:hypothetical protein
MDLLLIVAGLVITFATKNKRWLILTVLGIAWFCVDVLLIAMAGVR